MQPDLAKNTTDDLLPHERAAREQAVSRAEAAKEAAREHERPRLNIRRGAGPQHTRAGRPIFDRRSPQEQLELARREVERQHAREKAFERQRRAEAGAPPVIRRLGHVRWDNPPDTSRQSHDAQDAPGWSQLKQASERASQEQTKAQKATNPMDRFTEGRAQREEQAKFGLYTPLETRSTTPQRGSIPNGSGSQPSEGSKPNVISRSASPQHLRPTKQESKLVDQRNPEETVSWSAIRGTEDKDDSGRIVDRQRVDTEGENSSRPSRKLSTRFAEEESQPSYGKRPKGKDRDKAKRREKFAYEDEAEDAAREASRERAVIKKQRKREKGARKAVPIMLPEYISVANLAIALHVRLEDFVSKMNELGFEETSHDFILNSENAGLIAMEYNYDPIVDRGDSEDLKAMDPATDPSVLPRRPPVVTIMGHVDHGKTTILDYLRKSSVAATEHGGITQHIGAFSVPMPSGKTITFLDTPGHAAFLNMRQRGAVVTDIVILVVAADDSVKPQTIEAIKHAKSANVPIMVAINKIDKEDANIDRVKQDLARHGVDVEDFGGDVQVVCVSGKTGQGMDQLEEAAVALSEILDKRAEIDGPAEGWVLEASIKSMGKVATVLVRRGTMRPGDFIVAGNTWARIRCLRNEAGVEIEAAGPGTPVEIDGWREQPLAGDEVLQAPDEQKAKSVIQYRLERDEREKMAEDMEAINENRKLEQDKRVREKAEAEAEENGLTLDIPEQEPGGPELVYFIVKGDVSGSVEAVIDSIAQLGNKEVKPHVLRSGVGQVSEFDIEHAAAAKGSVITFNTEVDPHISRAAEKAKVTIIDQSIIYRLVDEVKAELSKHLPPLITQRVLGEADISQIFSITVKGRQQRNIAGCKVRNGIIARNSKVRVLRKGEKIFDGMCFETIFTFEVALMKGNVY